MQNINYSQIDNELIAAISAAIASTASRTGHKLIVRSVRRVPQVSPVWNTASRIEAIKRL